MSSRSLALCTLGRKLLVSVALAATVVVPVACDQSSGATSGRLVGVWRASFTDPLVGAAVVELNLMQDGSFLQQTSYQIGALVTIYGRWNTQVNGTQLRLNIDRGEPTQSCGPLGCTPITYPKGETHAFTFQGNTLTLRPVACVPRDRMHRGVQLRPGRVAGHGLGGPFHRSTGDSEVRNHRVSP